MIYKYCSLGKINAEMIFIICFLAVLSKCWLYVIYNNTLEFFFEAIDIYIGFLHKKLTNSFPLLIATSKMTLKAN